MSKPPGEPSKPAILTAPAFKPEANIAAFAPKAPPSHAQAIIFAVGLERNAASTPFCAIV